MKKNLDVYIPERLRPLVDRVLDHKVTLICAPAGYGKTELVKYWSGISQHSFVWLECTSTFNDPEVLNSRLLEIAMVAQPRSVIVIEESHLLTNPETLDLLCKFISTDNSGRAYIIVGRNAMNRIRNYSKLLHHLFVLTTDDLKFTEKETIIHCDHYSAQDYDNTHELYKISDGCPALISIALNHCNKYTIIDENGHIMPPLKEYILIHWLTTFTEREWEQIQPLCLVVNFTRELAQSILGTDALLNKMTEHLLIETVYVHNRQLYRFHPLVRHIINEQFSHENNYQYYALLANHAALTGDLSNAVELSLQSGNTDLALTFIKQAAPDMIHLFKYKQLKVWLRRIDQTVIDQDKDVVFLRELVERFDSEVEGRMNIPLIFESNPANPWNPYVSPNSGSLPFIRQSHLLQKDLQFLIEEMNRLSKNPSHHFLPYYHLAIAEAHYEQNQLTEAHQALEQMWNVTDKHDHPSLTIPALWLELRLSEAEYNKREAQFCAQEIYYRSLETTIPIWRRIGEAVKAYIAWKNGFLEDVEEWVMDQKQLLNHYWKEWKSFEFFIFIKLLIANHWLEEANYLLKRMVHLTSLEHNPAIELERKLLQTIVYIKMDKPDETCHLLIDALNISRKYGFIRMYLDQDPLLFMAFNALQEKVPKQLEDEYQKLFRLFRAEDSMIIRKKPNMKDALTIREIEILRCIRDGMSNRSIGQKLNITEGTVKGHLHRIFRKLNVTNRVQAVKKAEQSDLL